ncbi:MAG TPA: hypothetical protein VFS42_08015, partial [Burkholderiaceae bacterium]|nr:hypothetical protein [Burkholderiaceae bacterium]
ADDDELTVTLGTAFEQPVAPLRRLPELAGYWMLSARVARQWEAPLKVVLALEHACSDAGMLLGACEALILAKLHGTSQRAALMRALPESLVPLDHDATTEVDLAFTWRP